MIQVAAGLKQEGVTDEKGCSACESGRSVIYDAARGRSLVGELCWLLR